MQMDKELRAAYADIAKAANVEVEVKEFWHFAPTPFDKNCVEAVREGASRYGYKHMDIVSGAGHDAAYVVKVAPIGIIFVLCDEGISQNEIENGRGGTPWSSSDRPRGTGSACQPSPPSWSA